jgi:hypothetical protein
MSKQQSNLIHYNELPSFLKQRLWNNKSITLQITRDQIDNPLLDIKIIKNERDNIK